MRNGPEPVDFPLGTFTTTATARSAFYELVALSNEGRINLVAPTHEFRDLPPFRSLSISRLDGDPNDLYPLPGGGGGKMGIVKRFLDRLKALRGIQVISTQRVDDRTDDAVWEYTCTVSVPMLDGSFIQVSKSRTVDMRVGGPDLIAALGKDWQQKQHLYSQTRANGPSLCESKAQNRAVREALGLDAGIKQDAFMRPWAIVSLAQHIDPSQMSQRARDAVGMSIALGGNALFGKAAAALYDHGTPELVERTAASDGPPPQEPDQKTSSNPASAAAPGGKTEKASAATMERLTRAYHGLGKARFFEIADGVFGQGGTPDGTVITEAQAQLLLIAISNNSDEPPF